MKDIFGNQLAPGTYFCYSALHTKRLVMRIGRVTETGAVVVANDWGRQPDGSYGYAWRVMPRSRPSSNHLVAMNPAHIPQEVLAVLP